jgi:hypothetical protein
MHESNSNASLLGQGAAAKRAVQGASREKAQKAQDEIEVGDPNLIVTSAPFRGSLFTSKEFLARLRCD